MQKRSREQTRNIKNYKHTLEVMKYQENIRKGDLWYKVIKFINGYEIGKLITANDIDNFFRGKSSSDAWTFIHAICKAGYLEEDKPGWMFPCSCFKRVHDVPYHISREKFEQNHSGKMLWIESEVLFKKE